MTHDSSNHIVMFTGTAEVDLISSSLEIVQSTKFPSVYMKENLTATTNASSIAK